MSLLVYWFNGHKTANHFSCNYTFYLSSQYLFHWVHSVVQSNFYMQNPWTKQKREQLATGFWSTFSSYMRYNCCFSIVRKIESPVMHDTEQIIIDAEIGNNIRAILIEIVLLSILNIFPFYRNVVVTVRCRLHVIETQCVQKFMDYCAGVKATFTQIQSLRTILISLLVAHLRRAATIGLWINVRIRKLWKIWFFIRNASRTVRLMK